MTKLLTEALVWLRQNWLGAAFAAAALLIVALGVESCASRLGYARDIRAKDREIVALKRDIAESAAAAEVAVARALAAEGAAQLERAAKEKHKARAAELEREWQRLAARLVVLPPAEVVVETVAVLQVAPGEVTLQQQGVVFTLTAARRNLGFLQELTFARQQRAELALSLVRCEASETALLAACTAKDAALAAKDSQLADWAAVELVWDEKFQLSEARQRQARARGRREGAVVGGFIGFCLALLSAR